MTDEEMKNALKLIEENEELKERLRIESQSLHEQCELVSKQVEQIEKMKCCENCKYWVDNDCIIDHDYNCKRWNNHNTDDYWELAE